MNRDHWRRPLFSIILIAILLVPGGCEVTGNCQKTAAGVRKLTPEERGKHPIWEEPFHWWVVIFPLDPPPQQYDVQFDLSGESLVWTGVDVKPVGLEEPGKTRFGIPFPYNVLADKRPEIRDPKRWRILWPPCIPTQ
ncbi:MAG: hypothetical protein FJ005_08630 [Chloroflexi bacterium]|nr:hypothetical protein [Chloroflexota bacterium]